MYASGNDNFIIVEAFKDGFISENQQFHFQKFQEDSVVTIDGNVVPEPYQSRYLNLIASFDAKNPQNKVFGSLKCDGINMNKILDPSSTFNQVIKEVIYYKPPPKRKK